MRFIRLIEILMSRYRGHKIVHAAIDDVKEEDKDLLDMDAIFGGSGETPDMVDATIYYNEVYNQGLTRDPSTSYACGSTASHWIVNAANAKEGSDVTVDWVNSWNKQLDAGKAFVNEGSTMSSWIKFMQNNGLIQGSYIPKTPEQVHDAFCKGHHIWTGSNKIDWRDTRMAPYFAVEGQSYGHFFAIVKSDRVKRQFTCVQSYGTDNYDNGFFYIDWDDFDLLYTCVAFIDKEDVDSLEKLEKRLDDFIAEQGYSVMWNLIKKNRPDLTYKEKLGVRNSLREEL